MNKQKTAYLALFDCRLSQDDFRKLLATPRRPNNDGNSNSQFKAPAPKAP